MAAAKLLNKQELLSRLSEVYKKHSISVFDIFLIGSAVKDSPEPKDVDIVIVFKKTPANAILKKVQKLDKSIHVSYVLLTEVYTQPLWSTILREGYSVAHNRRAHDALGMKSLALFTYDLRTLGTKKPRFSQILKGYKSESELKKVNAQFLKPGVVLVPIEHSEEFRSFLEHWNVDYTMKRVLVS